MQRGETNPNRIAEDALRSVLQRWSVKECTMGQNDCLNYANRCIEIADELSDETVKFALWSQAKAWLQVADELADNDAFRKCVRDLKLCEPTAE
jgi:hypothetical protein